MTVVRPNSIAGINSITVQTGQALNIHDASGNLIRNITSSSGVSTFSSLHVGSGTTTSTQGISVGTGCSIVSTTVNQLELYTNSSERLRIDSSGQMGLGMTPTRMFEVKDSTGANRIANVRGTGASGAYLAFLDQNTTDDSKCRVGSAGGNNLVMRGDTVQFATGAGSEFGRFDSSGRLLVGATASDSIWGLSSALQVEGTSADTSAISVSRNTNDGGGAFLTLAKSRGTSDGSNTIVQDGDGVGTLAFVAADGTDKEHTCAYIQAKIDGTPGANDLPGRLIFSTTADGASSSTERLRISSDGGVKLTGHSERSVNALGNTTGSTTIDFTTADIITATLTGTTTFANPTTESVGQSGSIILTQDGTGSRTASWGSQFKWVGGTAPTLTTTAAAVDRIDYLVVAADTIHCVASLDVK